MAELVCPKCQSPMRSYERNGLQVDQCSGCQGIFLDRGELERLVDAESAYYERFPKGRERDDDDRYDQRRDRDDDDDRYERSRHQSGGLSELGGLGGLLGGSHGSHHGKHGYKRKKHKRESFLSELFD
jgi:Zn-finger nucleic acid-binding protein